MNNVQVSSEIGRLERVIIHRPGPEVELMTPESAKEVLYDDIIYLPRAAEEHDQLAATLRQFAEVHELVDLLTDVLGNVAARRELIEEMCELYACAHLVSSLLDLDSSELAHRLLVGTPGRYSPHTLAGFLAEEPYALPPMYNLYFTRDAAMCVGDRVIVGAMSDRTRRGEALLMKKLFQHHPALQPAGFYFDGAAPHSPQVSVEGGDVLVLREDLLIIGHSERTSVAGIDVLLQRFAQAGQIRYVIVQEIPKERAFIHFDMVFTMVDRDLCVIHEPVVRGPLSKRPILLELAGEAPPRIERHNDLLSLLAELGLPLTPILTGGSDPLFQAREQWHKATNFFAMAPGKLIGYTRNERTADQLAEHGFRIVHGRNVLSGDVRLTSPGRIAVMMEGAELSRGGGGCRCMTLPVRREGLRV
ncbi:MAG: arginine deiminase family protein [Ardenticatenaceae bacterium]